MYIYSSCFPLPIGNKAMFLLPVLPWERERLSAVLLCLAVAFKQSFSLAQARGGSMESSPCPMAA